MKRGWGRGQGAERTNIFFVTSINSEKCIGERHFFLYDDVGDDGSDCGVDENNEARQDKK